MGMIARMLQRVDRTGVPLLVARLFVGGLFGYLSYQKLADPLNFLKQVHEYGIFPTQPPELINSLAVIVPWLEMCCAVALLLGIFVRGAGHVHLRHAAVLRATAAMAGMGRVR